MVQQPRMGQGPLITVASQSHSDAPHSCRTIFDEWLSRRKDPYLTTHNMHNLKTSMPPAGLDLTIPGSERRQTHALHRAATRVGQNC
jgi:hypothetical protein